MSNKDAYNRGYAEGVAVVMKEIAREQKVSYLKGYVDGLKRYEKTILYAIKTDIKKEEEEINGLARR